jgi:hypothetical protein
MRRASFAVCIFLASMPAACDPPKASAPAGAAVVEPPPARDPLPAPVAATVRRLEDIAKQGTVRDMAHLADAVPGFRSNNAGMSHGEYWNLKMRAGDWPMAQVGKVLSHRFTVQDSAQGKIYIWPWLALLRPGEITTPVEREIDKLLGSGEAARLREGAVWPGYVLGIREDGVWLYFISGSG